MNTVRQDDGVLTHTEELVAEWRGLQERIDEIRQELGGGVGTAKVVKAVKAVKAQTPKQPKAPQQDTGEKRKRGRPPGSKNKPKDGEQPEAAGGDDGKAIDLPGLIETIGQQVHKPLTVADFVTLVLESGYTTKAKDFSNIVYQSLHKLVKRGMFVRNGETRAYEYVPQKVA